MIQSKIWRGSRQFTFEALTTALVAFFVAGCLQNGTGGGRAAGSTSGTSRGSASNFFGGSTGTTTPSTESQCTIFAQNATDYATCVSCKTSLCPCTEFYPNSTTCKTTDISACTVNESLLVACVHDNVKSAGGTCTGLKCGENQVADFVNCSCKDATPPTSIGPAPGHDDQSSPYMEPGFFISNRFCPVADTATVPGMGFTPVAHQCLLQDAGSGSDNGVPGATSNQGTPPRHVTQAPVNVLTDVGYIRWDLGLDASQYSPALPLNNKLSFTATQSTILGTVSMYYQLKPNTQITSNFVEWLDCVEHFSGYAPTVTSGFNSTNNQCVRTLATMDEAGRGEATYATPPARSIELSPMGSYAGTAKIEYMSLNGNSSNVNVTNHEPAGNAKAKITMIDASTSTSTTRFGIGKSDAGRTKVSSNNTSASLFDFTRDESLDIDGDGSPQEQSNVADLDEGGGTGLFSNIGYYKYTWGPLTVRRTNVVNDFATSYVTGQIAINANLGYTPASLVESSAYSPEAITGRVPTRDCSSSYVPNPCVVTGVYRAPGGAVMTQSYSPRFAGSRNASSPDALPPGVTAVSTPKIIEDKSQIAAAAASTTNVTAPRLRVFVRGADGNVHMSRFFAGSWTSWMNLGRPWVCNPSGTNSSQCIGATLPAAHRAFNSSDYPGLPRVWDHATDSIIEANNGISIAGEPVVASFMDTNVGAGNGIKGYIVVLVRVSHFKSTGGKDALPGGPGITYGPYHNAVFYTVAAVSTAPISGSATPYFDTVSNWSQWRPIVSPNGEVMRIQGNPTAFIKKLNTSAASTAEVRVYVLGTNAPGLHPPIAPKAANNSRTVGGAFGINPGWYNYGNMIVAASLRLDNPANNYENTSGDYTANLAAARYQWDGKTTGRLHRFFIRDGSEPVAPANYDEDDIAIISDIAWAPLDNDAAATTLDNSDRIRIFVNTYSSVTMNTTAGEVGVSPFLYMDRQIRHLEIHIRNDATIASKLVPNTLCVGSYSGINIFGNISAINLDKHARARTVGNRSTFVAATVANRGLFLFGRSVCPAGTTCDKVNPSVVFATVNGDANNLEACTNDHTVYYSATNVDSDTTTNSGRLVQQAYTSSDVIPIFSNALDAASTDVPVYMVFRNTQGNISNGFWGSIKGGTEGTKQFLLAPSGGPTN